jgi:bifunctional DNA-binding transcriptional regulator/antitoxin component of YhaV-PrlF toxin-antitoxin module
MLEGKAEMPYVLGMATALKISAKGQVTLKKSVLQHIGAKPGETVLVDLRPGGSIELHRRPTGKISDVFGMLYRPDQRTISIEEMNETIAKGWAGEI